MDKLRFRSFIRSSMQDIILENYYVGTWEMDFMRVNSNDYLFEYEFKVSKSDFKADFLKGRWYKGEFTYKHDLIKSGKRCNRFFFVVPKDLISISEVPDYCGLIYYDKIHGYEIVKNAKLLSKEKKTSIDYKHIAISLNHRETNLLIMKNLKRNKI